MESLDGSPSLYPHSEVGYVLACWYCVEPLAMIARTFMRNLRYLEPDG